MIGMDTSPAQADKLIRFIRGQRVILDADLAELYGVKTKRLNEQVRRNIARFPADFMFQLTLIERTEVVAKCDHLERLKFSPATPRAFTEHGAIMLASVLNSQRAIQVSVAVARAFVSFRRLILGRRELSARLRELEQRVGSHDAEIKILFTNLDALIDGPIVKPRRIGFRRPAD
jgi:hypothetical protein